MTEIYLRLIDLILTPLILVLAVFLFLRGHDMPGGGFIAGLTVAAAIELHVLARGAEYVRNRIGRYLLPLIGVGLLAAVVAALLGMFSGAFFHAIWVKYYVAGVQFKVGTPQLFDFGVTLAVIGMTTTYLLNLSDEDEAGEPPRETEHT
jgi:multicomponent Na+:H+ antiporter subunit B